MGYITIDSVEYQYLDKAYLTSVHHTNEKQRPIQLMVNNDENFPALKINSQQK